MNKNLQRNGQHRFSEGVIKSIRGSKAFSQRGVGILELMIALVVLSVITVSIFEIYMAQHRNYLTQEDVTNIQQNARAAVDELGRQIRLAGCDLPLGLVALEPANTDPDTITITYLNGGCETYLSDPMPQPSAELKCATNVSCFYENQWVYIYEPDSAIGEWLEITEVQLASRHIQHNLTILSRKYGANALVLAITQVKFYVDKTTDPDHPALMLQLHGEPPQVYAENITDLQFRYKMRNGVIKDEPTVLDNIREVKISLTGRSQSPDPDNADRPYRYRDFATSVQLRNRRI